MGGQNLDHPIGQGSGILAVRRVMRSNHVLLIENELLSRQLLLHQKTSHAYQNANGGIMVGVVDIVGNLFYNLKQHFDKVIADMRCFIQTQIRITTRNLLRP